MAGGQDTGAHRFARLRGVDASPSAVLSVPPCLSFYGCSTARHVITRCAAAGGPGKKRRNENSARAHTHRRGVKQHSARGRGPAEERRDTDT